MPLQKFSGFGRTARGGRGIPRRMAEARAGAASSVARLMVGRKRALPSGRAVVGGFLIAVAATGCFAAVEGAGRGPSHSYVVAARDVPVGTTITAADLRTATVDLPGEVADRSFARPEEVVGRLSVAPLHTGELLQASAVVAGAAADPRFQVSLPLDRSRALDGAIGTGEHVDVLATFGTGGDAATLAVARGAEVLGVDLGHAGPLGGTSGDLVVLLAVPTGADAIALSHAAQAGKLTLVRTTGATAAGAPSGPDHYRPSLDGTISSSTGSDG